MIETYTDLRKFEAEPLGDWFIHTIPADDSVHPMTTKPALVFVINLTTLSTYYFSFCHPDSCPEVKKEDFVKVLTSSGRQLWALDKKATEQLLGIANVYDANLLSYLSENSIFELSEYETVAHNLVRRNGYGHHRLNQAIPLLKHLELFNAMVDDLKPLLKNAKVDRPFIRFNDLIIGTLGRLEQQGICVDKQLFKHHFDVDSDGMAYSHYNVYTATGRPSNSYGGVNYAALNIHDGSRSCFVSRHGQQNGRIVVIDYNAFHPRIISTLTKYPIDVETNIYEYLARLYYQKRNVDETDIANAKPLTFRQLYGGVEDQYAHIKYLANLKTFINEQWEFFQQHGYVETPLFKRKITDKHILDPNPTKLFNYILQAVEGEIAIPKIRSVIDYLATKKTRAILYTYDAVLYDFHKDDGYDTLREILKIMSFDGAFPMKTYIGTSYQTIELIAF